MNVLVTGATGLVGHALAQRLVAAKHRVRALVRDPARAQKVLPPEIELVQGDVTEPASLLPAASGVEQVFHAAGLPEQWRRDPTDFDRVNRQGTANLCAAALRAKVRRVVYTSTLDVFAAPRGGTLVETRPDPGPKPTVYEQSKLEAEREVDAAIARGLDAVLVNPGAVYGPAPTHVTLNDFFIRVLNRKLPVLPPGGCAVCFIDGLVDAHLAAAERGASGRRYLVADDYLTMAELARRIAAEGNLARLPPVAPRWLVRGLAAALAPPARWFDFTPLASPGQVTFLAWEARVDTTRARTELGFCPTPLAQGIARTVASLREQGLVPR